MRLDGVNYLMEARYSNNIGILGAVTRDEFGNVIHICSMSLGVSDAKVAESRAISQPLVW